jgi:DNA-binding NarL/FixJ family response regulator
MTRRTGTATSDRSGERQEVGYPFCSRNGYGQTADLKEQGQATDRSSSRLDQFGQKISVVVSDANYMTSELLARALSRMKTLSILKSTVSFPETLDAIVELNPDIALVSTHLSDGLYRGLEVLRRARQRSVKTRHVVLMDDSEHEVVIDAFRAGAHGVVRRSTPINLLGRCIAAVHSGQIWASSADLQQVLAALEKMMPFRCVNAHGETLLTQREQDIVPLVADGLTNKEISSHLKLSEHTIKNHLFRIYEKLGISSRVELILYAVSKREPGR